MLLPHLSFLELRLALTLGVIFFFFEGQVLTTDLLTSQEFSFPWPVEHRVGIFPVGGSSVMGEAKN